VSRSYPITEEITAALSRFFHGGGGPSHNTLTRVFSASGYSSADPYDRVAGVPNKHDRVHTVFDHAQSHSARAHDLVNSLLTRLRVERYFDPTFEFYDGNAVRAAQRAFARASWRLSDDGELSYGSVIEFETGGRGALDEQLTRLQNATDDPALLIGTAKDLLEAVCKFVLEELGCPARANADFNELLYHARERLRVLPEQVAGDGPGAAEIKKILGAAGTIATEVNTLRARQGTGHGRTLPTGVTPETALLVVREACSIAEFLLRSLDRTLSRA
jgi:hypothetical protein